MEETQIDVDFEASLSESMKQKIHRGKTNEARNFTIFRTPHSISQSRKDLFEPTVISIGPFHRGKKCLKAMEEHKWRCLESFLSRGDTSLDLCISEMKLLEETTRRCYNETFDDLDSHAFVEMMVLDGCFLLEYFIRQLEENWTSIYEVGWNYQFVDRDLLLLENQIPYFIVEKLYKLNGLDQKYLMHFAKSIALCLLPNTSIFPDLPAETLDIKDSIFPDPPAEIPDSTDSTDSELAEIPDHPAEIHHLVHLCYHYLVPNPGIPVVFSSKLIDLTRMFSANRVIKSLLHRFHSTSRGLSVGLPNSSGNISSMVIPSATELKQKGVKFTPKSNPKHMFDISFEYGVLKIPRQKITDDTKPIFANLLAFEHSNYRKENKPFTRFVAFLDNLVNTPNDVTILQECGIIENWLGSEEEVTHFINQATEGIGFTANHYLAELYTEVNRYVESSWHRHRAKLIRDYFSSPWTAISLVAALILLVLTCVQSFYAVYAYKFPPSS